MERERTKERTKRKTELEAGEKRKPAMHGRE